MPVVWMAKGADIIEGKNVGFFAKRADAGKALREHKKNNKELEREGPIKVYLKGRDMLVAYLNGDYDAVASEEAGEAEEFL